MRIVQLSIQKMKKTREEEFITILSELGAVFYFKEGQKVRLVSCPYSVNGKIGEIINLRDGDPHGLIEVVVEETRYLLYCRELRPLHLRDIYEKK